MSSRRWSARPGWPRECCCCSPTVPPVVGDPPGGRRARRHAALPSGAVGGLGRSAVGLAATLAVVVLAGVWAAAHASENLARTKGSRPQRTGRVWVAQHGTMEMPTGAGVFGHLANLAYSGPAFYGAPHGTLQPQFMSGLPLVLAPAHWIGGLSWLFRANAVVGAFALLAFAAFVARAIGPRAAPFATAVLALAYPETHAFGPPYSEPLAQLLLFGGLCLLWDGGQAREGKGRAWSARRRGAGSDRMRSASMRSPTCCHWLPRSIVLRPQWPCTTAAKALTAGLFVGLVVGAVDGWVLHTRLRQRHAATSCGWSAPHSSRRTRRPVVVWVGRRPRGSDEPEAATGWEPLRRWVMPVLAVAGVRRPALRRPPALAGQRPHRREVGPLQALAAPDGRPAPHLRRGVDALARLVGRRSRDPAGRHRRRADRAPMAAGQGRSSCCRPRSPGWPWPPRAVAAVDHPGPPLGRPAFRADRAAGAGAPGDVASLVRVSERGGLFGLGARGAGADVRHDCAAGVDTYRDMASSPPSTPCVRASRPTPPCCSSTPSWPTAGRRPCATSAGCRRATSSRGRTSTWPQYSRSYGPPGRSLVLVGATAAELAGKQPPAHGRPDLPGRRAHSDQRSRRHGHRAG